MSDGERFRRGVNDALYLAMALGAGVVGLTLWSWGQPLTSRSGDVVVWVHSVWSSENSQQVADWYTLSHVIHGLLVALVGRALGRWIAWPVVIGIAVVTGTAWEIVEHTNWVLDRFRGQTIYQGYLGDTVLNAVCDYLFMCGGFLLGSVMTLRAVLALIVGLEVLSASIARDSLTLTTIRVVYPIAAITAWQDAANPHNAKPLADQSGSAPLLP